MEGKHLYRFGDFSLNAEDHSLSRGDENVPVTPKMFDLLLVLVQHPGRVLGKDFLLKSVWPDSFVEEGNITFNVRQLRKALGDSTQSPIYIETVPRRGYRFVAAVETETITSPGEEANERSEEASLQSGDNTRPSTPKISFALAAIVLISAAALAGAWFFGTAETNSASILAEPFRSEKLSMDGGVFHVAISPDGKNLVYTHRTAGKQSLWLRQLESSNNVPIVPPSDDFYGGLAISPDGSSVYFARGTQAEPQLSVYRMPIIGGVPQKILEGTQGWISLSTAGDKISYVRCPYTDNDYCSLYIADALNGGNEQKLVTRPRPIRIGDNKLSPDGRSIAFAAGQSRTSSNEFALAAVDIATRNERELTGERYFNISYLAWLPDQSGLLLTGMQLPDRNYGIWNVSLSSGTALKLTSDSETYSRLSLDAKGSVLVSTQVEPDFRLMVFEIDGPTTPRVLGNANTVAFAPDGRLYFSSARTGNFEVWSVNPDGSDLRQLTNDLGADVVPFVSIRSKSVYFNSDRTGAIQIWEMNPDGTNQRQVTAGEGGIPLRVSADGQWLYYRSSLGNNLRRVAIGTGQEETVLPEMGRGIVISPDLTKVAYSQRQGGETVLSVASLPEGKVEKSWRITAAPNLAHLVWSTAGDYLAYIVTDDARQIGGLWFQDLNGEPARQVADLSGDEIAELSALSLSDDGRRFAIIRGNWRHDAVLFRGLRRLE